MLFRTTSKCLPRRIATSFGAGIRYASTKNSGSGSGSLNIFLSFATTLVAGSVGFYFGKEYLLKNPPPNLFPLDSTTPLEKLEPPKYGTDLAACISELRVALSQDQVRDSEVEIANHTDNGFSPVKPHENEKPACIVYPESTEQVAEVMKIINKHNIPVVPYSGGTSLEGHFYSTRQPCIVLNTSRLNKILKINYDDLDAVVQAGVGWQDLNKHLEDQGFELMLGADCGSGAHICGMIATNASGVGAVKHGSMNANVISVTAVLADGTIIKTKQRPRKSSAGYNLTGLLVGSEGTLAIVTEAIVKLQVKPAYETVAVVQFESLQDCTNTVASLFKTGIQLNAVELLDKEMMKCINYSGLVSQTYLETPTLFFKLGGLNKTVVDEYVKEVSAISHKNKCLSFQFAKDKKEGEELFSARKNALYAMLDYAFNEIHEDAKMWITDIAVPLSRLAPVLEEVKQMIDESPLEAMILGHVGDGNFHADVFYRPEELEICKDLVRRMTLLGLKNDGTCSGEHGIGNGKRAFLEIELGQDTIDAMRKLKLALDPKRLLNPDKVFRIDPLDPNDD